MPNPEVEQTATQPETQEEAPKKLNEEEKNLAETEFDDFLNGLPEQEQSTDEPEQKEDATEEQAETTKAIELDGEKYTPEDIKKFRHAFENQSQWQKNLTEKSQIAAQLTPEQIETIMKATNHLREVKVPEEYEYDTPEIDLTSEEPFLVEVEDADGLPAEVDLKPYIKPFIAQYSKKLSEMEEKIREYETQVDEVRQQNAFNYLTSNMKEVPDLAIPDLTMDKLDSILRAGKTHPDYEKLMRFKVISNFANETGLDFKSAYRKLAMKEIMQEKEAERLKKNLDTPPPEPPAKAATKSSIDEFYDDVFGEDVEGRINALP